MREYENEGFADLKKVPKRDAEIAADAWCEGYEPLKNLLKTCIENGIQTFGCCMGHSDNIADAPYIYFNDQQRITTYLLQQMESEPSLKRIAMLRNGVTNTPSLVLTGDFEKREEFFNKISELVQKYLEEHQGIMKKILGFKTLRDVSFSKEQKKKILLGKCMDLFRKKGFKFPIYYDADTESYEVRTYGGIKHFTQESMEKFLETEYTKSPSKAPEMENSGLTKIIKNICESAQIGINEIADVRMRINVQIRDKSLGTMDRGKER